MGYSNIFYAYFSNYGVFVHKMKWELLGKKAGKHKLVAFFICVNYWCKETFSNNCTFQWGPINFVEYIKKACCQTDIML